ncbi:glycosyltransferase family 2 protein, partial [Escherichia coli]
ICCYNSENRIVNTLFHLSQCVSLSKGLIDEIILVDNNSSDETVKTAEDFWRNTGEEQIFKIVFESIPGLVHARRRGLDESKNEIVVFCDDDNWLVPSYFTKLEKYFENKQVGAVGGRGIPIANTVIPEWFFENLDAYACSAQTSNMLYGASLAIRSSILKKFYTDALSVKLKGRTKDSLDSGEDNLLCNFVKKQGYTLIPDNTPFCHFMESKRLDVDYLYKLAESFGKATASMKNNSFTTDYVYLTAKMLLAISRIFSKKNKKIY